jgi:biotin transport system substrate-specific component
MNFGMEKAWQVGIAPFVAASLIKNALGAALVPAIRRLIDRRP